MDRDGGTDRRRDEQKERLGQGERQERWTEGKTRMEEHEACTLCLSENL